MTTQIAQRPVLAGIGLAQLGVAAAIGMATVPAPVFAGPLPQPWTVICNNGATFNFVAVFSDAENRCKDLGGVRSVVKHGIKPGGGQVIGGVKAAPRIDDVRAHAATGVAAEGSAATAVGSDAVSVEAGVARPRGHLAVVPPPPDGDRGGDHKGGGKGDGIPVLNCAQSQQNPASVNLSTGTATWDVTDPTGAKAKAIGANNVAWSAIPGAQWIGPANGSTAVGNFVYETKVRVLKCPKGEAAKLSASFRADNRGSLALVGPDGQVLTTMAQAGTPNYGFLPASLSPKPGPGAFSFSPAANGVYTIRMTVQNSGSWTGYVGHVTLLR